MTRTGGRAASGSTGVIVLLAVRNLRRHLRSTLLTAAAMIVGGALLILSFSLGDGSHETWIDAGVRMGSGHVTIEHPAFQRSRKLEDRLSADVLTEIEKALASPAIAARVVAVSSKLAVNALASSAAGGRPAQVVAVDPVRESAFSTFDLQVVEGRYLAPDDRRAAYVGAGLAAGLDLRLGSRLVVQAQDAEREITGHLLRVVGIFRSGVPDVDQRLIHTTRAAAGEWLGSGGDVTTVGIVVDDSAAAGRVAARLRRELPAQIESGAVRVMEWRESAPALHAAVTIDNFGNYLIYSVLFTIIAFGIVNTMLMSVLHRRREFGVLQALGMTSGRTAAVALVEGLALTSVSGVIGISLGIVLTVFFFGDGLDFSQLMDREMTIAGVLVDPVVFPLFRLSRILEVLLFILGVGAAASLYPARRAARIDVTEAMKFDR